MKTQILFLGLLIGSLGLVKGQNSGKLIIRNASESYPTFIASLNGVRVENTYTNTVTFHWLDDNVFRLKVFQYGITKPLTFAVNCEANYISKYMITKDEAGRFIITLESKSLASLQETPAPVITPTVAPAQPTIAVLNAGPQKMPDEDYAGVVAAIKKENFENTKLDLARNFFATQHVSSEQVVGVVKLFSFEKNKVAFAKLAYSKTIDKQNYYKVFETLSFSNSKSELTEFINKNP